MKKYIISIESLLNDFSIIESSNTFIFQYSSNLIPDICDKLNKDDVVLLYFKDNKNTINMEFQVIRNDKTNVEFMKLLEVSNGASLHDSTLVDKLYTENIVEINEEEYLKIKNELLKSGFDACSSTISEKIIKQSCLDIERNARKKADSNYPLNFIIYGAPGTGKTYITAEYALAIVENRAVDMSRKTYEQRKDTIKKYNDLIKKNQIVFTTFHQSYGYEDFIQGLRPDTKLDNMSFITSDGVFKRIADTALADSNNNYVIIIDEINRANISKVFGELITLIEEDKRWGEVNQTCATLQSGDIFAVPNNLYIIGTMNSADKSISLIDAALRRRFEFIEQYPDESLVDDPVLKEVFKRINATLADSLESSDLLIGHSYFMGKTEKDLCIILNNSIIPLLYEYYYDVKKKVIGVLSDALKDMNYEIVDKKISRVQVVAKKEISEA